MLHMQHRTKRKFTQGAGKVSAARQCLGSLIFSAARGR